MSKCQLCNLGKDSILNVMPRGSITPDVYIVFDKPSENEIRYNDLIVGSRGQYLINSLRSVGIENFRYFSVIRCSCESDPTDEELEICSRFVKADIYKTNPKVILTIGAVATQAILGIKDKISNVRGLVKEVDINGTKFKVVPTYSPTYVTKKYNSDASGEFMTDIATVAKLVTGQFVDIMDKNTLEYALTYEEFKNYYINNLRGEELLAYDIETNAESVYSDKFRIIGWSLAKYGHGVYVCLSSLEYEMPEEDQQHCIDLLVAILKSTPKIVVHNALYERPATYFQYGYEMPFDKVEDTLVMAKIMLGGKIGAGLKPNARRIGYPDWETDLNEYVDNFCAALKRIKLAKNKLLVAGLNEGKTFDELFEENDDPKFDEIKGYYNNIVDVVSRYYDTDERGSILELMSKRFVDGLNNGIPGIIPYNWVPKRMLTKYGATDSLATYDLYFYFLERFKEDSTDEVDLNKGYQFDQMEHYAGYEMMLAGLHWDEDLAERDNKAYESMRYNSLKYMLLCDHPSMNNYLVTKWLPIGGPEVVYDSYNDYFWENFGRKVELKDDGKYIMRVDIGNGKTRVKNARGLFLDIEVPEEIMKDISSRVLSLSKKWINEQKTAYPYAEIFNPGSPAKIYAEIYNDIVLDDNLRVGLFINKVRDNILQNEEDDLSKYADFEKQLIGAIDEYLKLSYDQLEERSKLFEPIKQCLLDIPRMQTQNMQEFLGEMHDLRLQKLSEETQLLVYECLRSTPIDTDNSDTWTPQFKWNFCLRMYKKATKIITAYIDGKVGRQSAYQVDKTRLQAGDDIVYREESYNKLPELKPNHEWLEQTNFGVGTAETGRWRSAIHVMPAGSTVKRLYTSRFVGGTIFQPDFSANELRCVASAAHEDNMLEAFRQGLDIHKSNASKVFRVPMDEVTTFQRRWAKTMSFMTLYGGSAYSLAESYFNGDMIRAQEQLDGFYGAFPKLKEWIDSKHEEVLRTHKVSTLTHRFINIDFDPSDRRSVNQALRQSSNYPIQSFRYSTGIIGLDGKIHKIGELADNQEDLWVYTYDKESEKVIPVKGIQAQCTGTTDTWYKITLDNGKYVEVTPEHKMMLRDGTYCRADKLKIGQSLMPLYVDRFDEDYQFVGDRLRLTETNEPIQQLVHDYVYGYIEKTGVHHINCDKDDNRPENLIRLSNSRHVAYHRNFYEYLIGSKSFEDFIGTVKSEIIKNYPDRYEERIEDIKRLIEEIPEERKIELSKRSMTYRNEHRSELYEDWDKNQREAVSKEVYKRLDRTGNAVGMDHEEFKAKLSESWSETYDYRIERLKEGHNTPEARRAHSIASKKAAHDPEVIFSRLRSIIGYMLENNLPWRTREEWDNSIMSYPKKQSRRYSGFIDEYLGWDNFVDRADEFAKTYNHKIVDIKVIHLDEPEKKYDLHIPKYHNFALECGVFSHNSASSTMAAVVFCDILLYLKKNGYKSKGICFIHDSLESDIAPFELIEIIKYQQHALATGAIDYFGIECKADVSMGYSMGHECEMSDFKILDDAHTKAEITLEGFYSDILDTINNWKLAYNKVEIIEEDIKDEYLSISEMFIARKAFDYTAMAWNKKGKVKVYIQYYNDKGEIEPMTDQFESINIWDHSSAYQYLKNMWN